MAVAYAKDKNDEIQTRYFDNMEDIENALMHLREHKLLTFNIGFEKYVLSFMFPHIKLQYGVDLQRMSQLRGLPEGTKKDQMKFSLKATTARFLPHLANYELKYYEWLRNNKGVRRGKEGGHLHELPPDMLEAYKQALEMEKQQINDAVEWGNRKGYDEHRLTCILDEDEDYYNETYKKD
jgi:hypothetical protein